MKILLNLCFLIFVLFNNVLPQKIRPVRDDVGFCWRASDMDTLISYLEKQDSVSGELKVENLIAGISPHDDYLYAGRIYYPLYQMIRTKEVVVFGVTHGTVRKEMNDPRNVLILDDFNYWRGPYSDVGISPLRELIVDNLSFDYFIINNKAQELEHSVEALIPFLQYYNRDIKITSIMVTAMSFDKMDEISDALTEIIAAYIRENNLKLGDDIFFLISNDANHYGLDFNNAPYGENEEAHLNATREDKRIALTAFRGVITKPKIEYLTKEIWPEVTDKSFCPLWCGRYPIPFGLLTTVKIANKLTGKNIYGTILKYSDTWTEGVLPIKNTRLGLTAPFSLKHWVGFLSAGFYLE